MKNIIIVLLITVLVSCSGEKNIENKLFVSILPQKYFLEKIVGDEFKIEVMVKPGMSPATYEPLPTQMLELSHAKIFFSIGVPFEENWLSVIQENNKNLTISKTDSGIHKREIESIMEVESGNHDHGHVHGEHCNHEGNDPHIWLDPLLVKDQAQNMFNTLAKIYPDKKGVFENNLNTFNSELDSLNSKLESVLSNVENRAFLVFHPSWGYFADRYNLKQYAIEVGGKEPSAKELSMIVDKVKDLNLRKIIIQKQFSAKAAEAIAKEIGAKTVKIDQLSYNYKKTLLDFAGAIKN